MAMRRALLNKGLELTASSLCFAPASGSSSGLAFGLHTGGRCKALLLLCSLSNRFGQYYVENSNEGSLYAFRNTSDDGEFHALAR
jgi:hypothetical protein